MKYIYINFLPGSAGNFLSRAIGLCDNVYSHSLRDKSYTHDDVTSKFESYSYKKVMDRKISDLLLSTWDDFERELDDIQHNHMDVIANYNLDETSTIVILEHPHEYKNRSFAGKDDTEHTILINCDESLELAFCNALYKDGTIRVQYLQGYNEVKTKPNTYQINFIDFFDTTTFMTIFVKLCEEMSIDNPHLVYVEKLHKEWLTTALMPADISTFTKAIKKIRRVAEQSRILIGKGTDE